MHCCKSLLKTMLSPFCRFCWSSVLWNFVALLPMERGNTWRRARLCQKLSAEERRFCPWTQRKLSCQQTQTVKTTCASRCQERSINTNSFNISLQHGVSPREIFERLNETCKKTCTSSLLSGLQHSHMNLLFPTDALGNLPSKDVTS